MTDRATPGAVTAVVLAAGAARRFGRAKQLEAVGGLPLVLHAVRAAARPGVAEVLVVVGSRAAEVRAVLTHEPVRFVDAPDWERGLGHSLAAGLRAAPPDRAVMVLLADQPGVNAAVVDRVLRHPRDGVEAVRASFAGRPGHPVLLMPAVLAAAPALHGDRGAAPLLAGRTVALVPCDDIGHGRDVDTPEDLAALTADATEPPEPAPPRR